MNSFVRIAVGMAVVATAAPVFAQLSESFPDPLGGYYGRWLGANSNLGSYYYATGTADPDYRGNNPVGLWATDTQVFNGGVGGPTMDIIFNDAFAATIRHLDFGVECFTQARITMYDINGAQISTFVYANGDFGFGHEDIVSGDSTVGIKHVLFDSTQFGGGQIEGNTSVDEFHARVVPEPCTMLALAGAAAFLARRRKAS